MPLSTAALLYGYHGSAAQGFSDKGLWLAHDRRDLARAGAGAGMIGFDLLRATNKEHVCRRLITDNNNNQ